MTVFALISVLLIISADAPKPFAWDHSCISGLEMLAEFFPEKEMNVGAYSKLVPARRRSEDRQLNFKEDYARIRELFSKLENDPIESEFFENYLLVNIDNWKLFLHDFGDDPGHLELLRIKASDYVQLRRYGSSSIKAELKKNPLIESEGEFPKGIKLIIVPPGHAR